MSSIEEELWNIFTYYTLTGNSRDPSRLNNFGLVKLCRETMLSDPTMTERPLSQADIHLLFTAELKRPDRYILPQTETSDKLNYDEFLSCLNRIAAKCYPSSTSPEESLQQLLMDNILPLSLRRKPFDVSMFVRLPSVVIIYNYYEEALTQIFKFYTICGDHKARGKNMIKTTNATGSFDEHRQLILEAKEICQIQISMSDRVGYSEFIRFANDFGLATSLGLTTLDLGDIYLNVIAMNGKFAPILRKLDFDEFWEAIIRCALHAFRDDTELTTEDKIRAMFMCLWRHLQSRTKEHVSGYGSLAGGGFDSYKGGLLRGSQLLNQKFIAMWAKDGYRDYLDKSRSPQIQRSRTLAEDMNAIHSLSTPDTPPLYFRS